MQLILIRHGETFENKKGIIQGHLPGRLTDEGIRQSEKLGNKLKEEEFDIIYCSDLRRTKDTAKIIMRHNLCDDIVFTEELRERAFGNLQGMKAGEISVNKYGEIEEENGESVEELHERAQRFISKLRKKHKNETVLIITHGGFGKALVNSIYGKSREDIMDMESLKNASISSFEMDDTGEFRILKYNNTEHLEEL